MKFKINIFLVVLSWFILPFNVGYGFSIYGSDENPDSKYEQIDNYNLHNSQEFTEPAVTPATTPNSAPASSPASTPVHTPPPETPTIILPTPTPAKSPTTPSTPPASSSSKSNAGAVSSKNEIGEYGKDYDIHVGIELGTGTFSRDKNLLAIINGKITSTYDYFSDSYPYTIERSPKKFSPVGVTNNINFQLGVDVTKWEKSAFTFYLDVTKSSEYALNKDIKTSANLQPGVGFSVISKTSNPIMSLIGGTELHLNAFDITFNKVAGLKKQFKVGYNGVGMKLDGGLLLWNVLTLKLYYRINNYVASDVKSGDKNFDKLLTEALPNTLSSTSSGFMVGLDF